MTNREAIERIKDHMRVHKIGEYPHVHIAEALNLAIAALESPRPDWTPCAEGLPTPEQAVIDHDYQKFFVTLQNLDGKRFVERCAYRCERWWMFDYQCYADETHAIALAWMPCPTTPYNPDHNANGKVED